MGDPSNVTSFENGVLHNFLDRVYGIVWLNESFPAFTTSGTYYVVAPFTASNGNHSANTADATLTASTLLYETDLLCEPANIIPTPPTNSFAPGEAYNITNSQGFNIQIGGKPQGNGYHPTYATGVFESYCVGHPSSISQPGEKACGPLNTSFLATWQNDQKSGEDETKGLLAAFCKPTYYSQTADVTISQQNQSILSLTPSGERAPLDPLNFDQDQFATVVSSINIDQAARVVAMGLGYEAYGTVPTIIGIGLALTGIPHSQLPQSGNLETVLGTGYKLMFTLAAQTQISYNAATIPISMQQDTIVDAVVMVRAFAIVIEVLLGVIAAIAVLIFVLNAIRANKLQSDPHSLAYLMALSSSGASKPLLDSLSMHEMATETQLDTAYRDLRFVLREGTQSPIRCLSLLSDHPKQSAQEVQNVSNDSSEAPLPRITKPAYMVQLSWAFGIPFVVTLALLIVALSILRYFNGKYQGKQIPPVKIAHKCL